MKGVFTLILILFCSFKIAATNKDSTNNINLTKSYVFIGYGFQSHTHFWLHSSLRKIAEYNSKTPGDIDVFQQHQNGPIYFYAVFNVKKKSYLGFSLSNENYTWKVQQNSSSYSYYLKGNTFSCFLKYNYQLVTTKHIDLFASASGGIWYSKNAVSVKVPQETSKNKIHVPVLPVADIALGVRIKLTKSVALLGELGLGSATAKVGICFIQD